MSLGAKQSHFSLFVAKQYDIMETLVVVCEKQPASKDRWKSSPVHLTGLVMPVVFPGSVFSSSLDISSAKTGSSGSFVSGNTGVFCFFFLYIFSNFFKFFFSQRVLVR